MSYLCYHHNDMDGKGAADQVYQYLLSKGIESLPNMFIMRGYDDPFSENDYTNKDIIIVDLSFTEKSIENLFAICEGASSVLWIDHHKSSELCIRNDDICKKLNNYKNLTYFVNQNGCGTMLAYLILNAKAIDPKEYALEECLDYEITYKDGNANIVFPDAAHTQVLIPRHISLIDKWDRWVYGEENDPVYFNFGTQMYFTGLFAYKSKDDTEMTYNDRFWKSLRNSTFINTVIDKGATIKRYIDQTGRKNVNSRSYECMVKGHKALVLNSEAGNSMIFGNKMAEYDLCILWRYDGKHDLYTYSLYSDGKVDCAAIATSLNPAGGGHPGAAGFSSKEQIFKPM